MASGSGADAAAPGGLVFGYGAIGEGRIDEGIRRLADVIRSRRVP